jgi:DNA-binding Lrp family transcriptional regulator
MSVKLDEKDLAILTLIQENSKLTANQIAKKISTPITTVFAKIKRMEELGVITQYRAILSAEKLNLGTAAFILSFSFLPHKRRHTNNPTRRRRRNRPFPRSTRSPHHNWRLGPAGEATGRKCGISRQIRR